MQHFEMIDEPDFDNATSSISNSTCDLDCEPSKFFKAILHSWKHFMVKLINTSFETGVFPVIYKDTLVVPQRKKPFLDTELLKNYQPTANLIEIT